MSLRFAIKAKDENHLSNVIWIAKDYLALNASGPFSVYIENGNAIIELDEAEDSFLLKLSAWGEIVEQSTLPISELNIKTSYNTK